MLSSRDFQQGLFQDRVKEPLCVHCLSNPKAELHSNSPPVREHREISEAGWLTVKNLFLYNRESARLPGASALPTLLVGSTSVAPV